MSVIDDMIGLTIIDNNNNVLLIQPTKRDYTRHKMYLHNLNTNKFVSTLFVKKITDEIITLEYNSFNLDKGIQEFYIVSYNVELIKFNLCKTKEKKITKEFIEMEREKLNTSQRMIRKYKEFSIM